MQTKPRVTPMPFRWLVGALVLVLVAASLAGPARAQSQQEITVSAAISLKNAFTDIGGAFEKSHPGVKVNINFGSSGALAKQILSGAPVDVYASAAQKDMNDVDKAGLLSPGTRADFARNGMVLVQPRQAHVKLAAFSDLTKLEVKKIAVGNPKTVPAGRYAMEVLQYYKIADALKDKLVLAENVRQVLDYVARGEVDAGLVYPTDAMTRPQEVQVIATAPPASHKPVVYPLALLKDAPHAAVGKEFIATVLSPTGQEMLKKNGFIPVSSK